MTDWNAIRQATDAATEGPWEAISPADTWAFVNDAAGDLVGDSVRHADADFIALSRTALPDMLALLEEARAALWDAAIDAHDTGSVLDHWGTPIGDGPAPFITCDDRFCEERRTLLSRLPEAEK